MICLFVLLILNKDILKSFSDNHKFVEHELNKEKRGIRNNVK